MMVKPWSCKMRHRTKSERYASKYQRYPARFTAQAVQNLKDVLKEVPGVQLTNEGITVRREYSWSGQQLYADLID